MDTHTSYSYWYSCSVCNQSPNLNPQLHDLHLHLHHLRCHGALIVFIQSCTPHTYFLPCLPPCVSRPRTDVLLDSGSSVLHGQLLHCRGDNCSVLYSQMAGVMTPETLDSHTELLWYPWGLSSTVTLSIPVFTFWIDMLIIVIATAVHRSVCLCDFVCFLRSGCFVSNVTGIPQKQKQKNIVTLCRTFTVKKQPGIILETWAETENKPACCAYAINSLYKGLLCSEGSVALWSSHYIGLLWALWQTVLGQQSEIVQHGEQNLMQAGLLFKKGKAE